MDDMETCPMPHMFMESARDEMAAKLQEEHDQPADDTQVYEWEAGSGKLAMATIEAAPATKAIANTRSRKLRLRQSRSIPQQPRHPQKSPKPQQAPLPLWKKPSSMRLCHDYLYI